GGHIMPLISVAEKLPIVAQSRGIPSLEFFYLGVPGMYAQELTSKGITVSRVASVKMRRGAIIRNIIELPLLIVAIIQALWRVYWIMPDVLFSKGGPGALPVVLACAFYRIPIIIHESDSVAGLTNLASARFAKRIAIAYATAKESFVGTPASDVARAAIEQKIALIGNPIRNFFLTSFDTTDRATVKRIMDFDPAKPLLVVIGGSQGAVRINEFLLSIAEDLLTRNIQVLHQTGVNNIGSVKGDLALVMKKYSNMYQHAYRAVPYFEEDIKDAYCAADIVISRAGSGSIFEIAAMGRPAILIPLPQEISRDQVKNAFEYAATGAAITIEESNLTRNIFLDQLDRLLANPTMLASMAAAAKAFSRPEAAEVLAKEIVHLGRR
ncbi:MAG: hypothetical protein UY00_C0028G0004, partial [Candidatus Wolfebacteria bacterium GW2011_GWA1_47_6]